MEKDDLYLYLPKKQTFSSLQLLYFDSITQEEKSIKDSTSTNDLVNKFAAAVISPRVHNDAYYKSDFHKLNLKRSKRKQRPLSENEFEQLIEEGSIESLSGTDSETESGTDVIQENYKEQMLQFLILKAEMEDELSDSDAIISYMNTQSPFLLFRSSVLPSHDVFGIYKSLFTVDELGTDPCRAFQRFSTIESSKTTALLMIGGGHFAGAIVSHALNDIKVNANSQEILEQKVDFICSKSFHRYTTRRKQGGSQSASDNANGKANSAGSSIRRYNEQALIKEVRELLLDWSVRLEQCTLIFIRANGAVNRSILVGYDGAPIQSNDTRLRKFPFTTKRATVGELKRAWVELSYIQVLPMPHVNERAKRRIEAAKPPQKMNDPTDSTSAPKENPNDLLSLQLITLIKKQKVPMFINFLRQHELDPNEFCLSPPLKYYNMSTMLHYAAANNLCHMIAVLLISFKADPCVLNESGKTPFQVAYERTAKKAFQIARYNLGEDAWDWSKSGVDIPKSKKEFDKEEAIEQTRITQEKQRVIEQELAKKTKLELKVPQCSALGVVGGKISGVGMNDLAGLSDQQKMRIMREQRARAAESRLKKQR